MGFIEARYDEFRNFDANNDGVYEAGIDDALARNLDFAQVPRWTAYFAAQHERPWTALGGASLTLRASYAWRDWAHGDVRNDPFLIQDAYGLLDLNATLALRSETLRITAFGKNLTGATYFDLVGAIGTLATVGVGGTPPNLGCAFELELSVARPSGIQPRVSNYPDGGANRTAATIIGPLRLRLSSRCNAAHGISVPKERDCASSPP